MSLLLLGLLSTAHANDRAKELYFSGKDLYNQGRYEPAITAWKEAYGLDPRPDLQFNLSNAYERSGMFVEALEALTTYRPFAKPGEGEALDSRIRSLQDRVKAQKELEAQQDAEREAAEKALAEERRKAEELARQQAEASKGTAVPIVPIAVTVAGVGLLAFGGSQALAVGKHRKVLKDPALCTAEGLCKAGAAEAADAQKRAALLADVGLISGAVAVGLGAVLFVSKKKAVDAEGVSLTPRLDVVNQTVGVSGVW